MCSSSGVWAEQLRRRPCVIEFVHGSKISTQKKKFFVVVHVGSCLRRAPAHEHSAGRSTVVVSVL